MRLRGPVLSIMVALLAGCAAQSQGGGGPLVKPLLFPTAGPAAPDGAAAVPAASGGYKLTAEEGKLDCAKLTGRMKVRIGNMRAAVSRPSGTAIGQTIQSAVTPVYGGTTRGIDPTADLQFDRAKLEAYNARLSEKKCKTLDLDAELRGESPSAQPAKSAPPKKAG